MTSRIKSVFLCCLVILFIFTIVNPAAQAMTRSELESIRGGWAHFDPDAGLHVGACSIVGSAKEALSQQPHLDSRWVDLIVREAAIASADPLAMAAVLYWENRQFPDYGPKTAGSDTVGRGPWQIIAATWAGHMHVLPEDQRDYHENVIHPEPSTKVAASIVRNYGGVAGVPVGSVDQDFGRNADSRPLNVPSIATFSKNYNAGQATWRDPGVAGHLESGRTWMDGSKGPWFNDKQKIIDDYIVASTYIYYKLARGEELPVSANTDLFVSEGLSRQTEMEGFVFLDSSGEAGVDVSVGPARENAEGCAGAVHGDIVRTALNLAWDTKGHGPRREDAKPQYANPADGDPPGALHTHNDQRPFGASDPMYSDCGVYVATVMRASGADPDFPQRGTYNQLPYLEQAAREGKYMRIDGLQAGDTSKLEPGDVLITVAGLGHVYIYTGPYENAIGETYNAAQASFHNTVPQAQNYYQNWGGQVFVAFRLVDNRAAEVD